MLSSSLVRALLLVQWLVHRNFKIHIWLMNIITSLLKQSMIFKGHFLGNVFFFPIFMMIKKVRKWLLIFHDPIFLFKMIYLIRNPRDVLVSGYFFWRIAKFVKRPQSLEQYFEWFVEGNGEWMWNMKAGSCQSPSSDLFLFFYPTWCLYI